MRCLVLGGRGMLGGAIEAVASRRGLEVLALAHRQADITDTESVAAHVERFRPELLINSAAFTDVDGCENERELAEEVNGAAVGRLAALAARTRVPLVHVSSDYVFDGAASTPYVEEAPTRPVTEYGRSKLLGEQEALDYSETLVVRASWLFGPGGKNFAATIHRLARLQEELRVVDDQIGCPTYTPYLAIAILDLASRGARGVVHYRNEEPVSWFQFARTIVELSGSAARVHPCTTEELSRPAPRPAYSVLDVTLFERLTGRRVESWRDGLREYLPQLPSSIPSE